MVESKVAASRKIPSTWSTTRWRRWGRPRVYGARLIRGLLWVAVYVAARDFRNRAIEPPAAIALLPVPFFVCGCDLMKGVGQMDELERRIEPGSPAFAFPIAVVLLDDAGSLDTPLNPDD